jgi:hypothetical protein
MSEGERATEVRQQGSTDDLVMGGGDYLFRHPLQPELECQTIYD